MRTRVLCLITLVTMSADLGAQVIRLPRGTRQTPEVPAPLPPEAAPVSRSLAYKRSHWSSETYALLSSMQTPTGNGGVASYTAWGAGTHGDYRFTEGFSATLDMTASLLEGTSNAETAEVGGRYSPLSWDHPVRPFFDVRGAFMHMYDRYLVPAQVISGSPVSNGSPSANGRYSRGFGGVIGSGLEFALSPRYALTTGVSMMRNRMATYRLTGTPTVSGTTNYWMTSTRIMVGLKFTPVAALHLAQNPTQ